MKLDNEELEATKKNREKDCNFCEELEFWKEQEKEELKYDYLAKLGIYTYRKDNMTLNPKGTITSKPYSLNYCPMCGRKLV